VSSERGCCDESYRNCDACRDGDGEVGPTAQTAIRRFESAKGYGLGKTTLTMMKTAVLAPIPEASVRIVIVLSKVNALRRQKIERNC